MRAAVPRAAPHFPISMPSHWDAKLIRSPRHPDTATVMRAVEILGWRRVASAVGPLVERSADADPYLVAAIVRALSSIPGAPSRRALHYLMHHDSVIVRREAVKAIAQCPVDDK
jgi:HEAT repeat protein